MPKNLRSRLSLAVNIYTNLGDDKLKLKNIDPSLVQYKRELSEQSQINKMNGKAKAVAKLQEIGLNDV